MSTKKLLACLVALFVMASAVNASAAWYTVKIKQIVPRAASGDSYVQLLPGATETAFTGVARGIIQGTDTGANKMVAVFLTAVSLGNEVTVEMANVPSWDTPQVISSTGLTTSE